ncbi:MAG: DUF6525 family protein [Roseomonas mucosa]|nr:DUF6525 family protein [Roseomonas mucosa]
MLSNSVVAGATVRKEDFPNRWEVYDSLPPRLRRAMQESVLQWNPVDLAKANRAAVQAGLSLDEACEFTYRLLVEQEAMEVREFSRRAIGGCSAHVAARASILRYSRH